MAKVLIVYHSLSGNTKAAAAAVAEGVRAAGGTALVKEGLKAGPDDLLGCDAVALGSPDYFSYIAGGLKDFFDRTYYPTQGKVTGKPYAAFGSAGGPAATVIGCIERMAQAFKLTQAAEPVGAAGKPSAEILEQCRRQGAALARAAAKGTA